MSVLKTNIEHIFNHRNYSRLTYPAGFGGEWLCNIIGRESEKYVSYVPSQREVFLNENSNRHFSETHPMLSHSILRFSKTDNIDSICATITNNLMSQGLDPEIEINDLLNYLENNRETLFKQHICFNPIFNNARTFVIHFSDPLIFTRFNNLGFLKLLSHEIDNFHLMSECETALRVSRHFLSFELILKYTLLIEKLKTTKFVTKCSMASLLYEPFEFIDNEFFLSSPSDTAILQMYKRFYLQNSKINEYVNYQIKNVKSTANNCSILLIEKFGDVSYLQEKFKLKRDITEDFLYWESLNDKLLQQYGL